MTRGEYGPQDAAADRFLELLDRLDTPDVVALGAAGGGVVGTDALDPQVIARAELRRELREIARRAGRLDAVRAIGGEVERWAGSARHWFPAGVAGTLESTTSLGPRMAALPVVLDAAYGIVLADQLREAELAILLGPWRDIAGDPFETGSAFGERERSDGDPGDGDAGERDPGGPGWRTGADEPS
ncbi:MAG: hypothetical protein P4L30_00935 [Candidatus Limnocylindrales bacterium]|nr:hypothetical protein [Candidatus Limnocylindrales bacterium]